MSDNRFADLDQWMAQNLLPHDPLFDEVLQAAREAGLPAIDVSAMLGAGLGVLVRAIGAQRILEIGTLAGFSAIHMARALPANGQLISIEYDPAHAKVAQANFDRAGLSDRIDLRIGAALDVLPELADEGGPAFDMAFLDADKENNPAYADWAARLLRPGGLLVIDNVVRGGAALDADPTNDKSAQIHRLFAAIKGDARFQASALQIVGSKGWDGILIAARTDAG